MRDFALQKTLTIRTLALKLVPPLKLKATRGQRRRTVVNESQTALQSLFFVCLFVLKRASDAYANKKT
jgi:hypothetical protein